MRRLHQHVADQGAVTRILLLQKQPRQRLRPTLHRVLVHLEAGALRLHQPVEGVGGPERIFVSAGATSPSRRLLLSLSGSLQPVEARQVPFDRRPQPLLQRRVVDAEVVERHRHRHVRQEPADGVLRRAVLLRVEVVEALEHHAAGLALTVSWQSVAPGIAPGGRSSDRVGGVAAESPLIPARLSLAMRDAPVPVSARHRWRRSLLRRWR